MVVLVRRVDSEEDPVAQERQALAEQRAALEADFDDVDELREEIRITVLHELGHYFGLDEDRLSELGYE